MSWRGCERAAVIGCMQESGWRKRTLSNVAEKESSSASSSCFLRSSLDMGSLEESEGVLTLEVEVPFVRGGGDSGFLSFLSFFASFVCFLSSSARFLASFSASFSAFLRSFSAAFAASFSAFSSFLSFFLPSFSLCGEEGLPVGDDDAGGGGSVFIGGGNDEAGGGGKLEGTDAPGGGGKEGTVGMGGGGPPLGDDSALARPGDRGVDDTELTPLLVLATDSARSLGGGGRPGTGGRLLLEGGGPPGMGGGNFGMGGGGPPYAMIQFGMRRTQLGLTEVTQRSSLTKCRNFWLFFGSLPMSAVMIPGSMELEAPPCLPDS